MVILKRAVGVGGIVAEKNKTDAWCSAPAEAEDATVPYIV